MYTVLPHVYLYYYICYYITDVTTLVVSLTSSEDRDMPAIEEMSVAGEVADEDVEDVDYSSGLGKRKRDQTTRYNPSEGVAGPSKKSSKRRSTKNKEVLDDVIPPKVTEPSSGRDMLQKIFLDLMGDEAHSEDDKLIVIANELTLLTSFNKEQTDAWVLYNRSFVKPE